MVQKLNHTEEWREQTNTASKENRKNGERILSHRIFMPGGLLQIIWFMFSVLQVKKGNSERVRDRLPVAQQTLNPGC